MSGDGKRGFVWLVGAGPGDPGLITVAGSARIAEADVLVYDRLANPRLLAGAPPETERIYVGKTLDHHTLTQDEINALLVERGRAGQTVVRLKGGDPFVFGRGGEEAEALRRAGVAFAVVPGVTSAIAAAAYAGIPVTQRGLASSFAVITGHEDPTKEETSIDWAKIAGGADTLVFLMGIGNLELIARQLIAHGRRDSTPAAVVASGTLPGQRVVTGTLADIAQRAAEADIQPPAVTIVGEVARLREELRWFDNRPLFGKRVLVTRAREQASALSARLEAEGAAVVEMPTIAIRGIAEPETARAAIATLADGEYAWAIFTSANAVDILLRRVAEAGRDARVFACRIGAIGPETAAALAAHGLRADIVPAPERSVAEGLLEALAGEDLTRKRVLLPRAAVARDALPEGLRRRGAAVDVLELYRIESPAADPAVLEALAAGEIDIVTFASSSTVRNLAGMLGGTLAPLRGRLIASIGPITSEAVREYGLGVDVEAGEHTIAGLVSALREHFSASPSSHRQVSPR
ncbi:MAG: uroporphyrinogen-III C-methyltransferase [Dehalococcoidia bacterium]|nr:uroporphyrinogen-III C-methyltransferase [Dehalococcoidia bacterium]